jgi:hypothetical protein
MTDQILTIAIAHWITDRASQIAALEQHIDLMIEDVSSGVIDISVSYPHGSGLGCLQLTGVINDIS